MSYNLCKAYPALDPFRVDELPLVQVAEVYRRTISARRYTDPDAPAPGVIRTVRDGKTVELRPAGDSWF